MISNKHKCIFVHINKAGAGTSIDMCVGGLERQFHKPITYYQRKWPKKFKSYFKFCFIRNPWEKVISQWKFRITHVDEKDVQNMPFDQWVRNPTGLPFKPQYDWISDKKDNILVDFIGRYENFSTDWQHICSKINFNPDELTVTHKTKHSHYSKYYNEETKEIVAKAFQKDIKYFGYKFEN